MPLNLPEVTLEDITFGPAVVYLGVAGETPTVDVGAVGDDGVTVEIASEQVDLMQGNPKLIEMTVTQSQAVSIKLTSMEWNFDTFAYALGAGATVTESTYETFEFGGEPCVTEVALQIVHQTCRSGDTLNLYVWRAVGDGNMSLGFPKDGFHEREHNFKVLRAATDWADTALDYDKQLIKFERQFA